MFAIKTPNGYVNADRFDTRAEAQEICDDVNSDDFFTAHNRQFTVVEVEDVAILSRDFQTFRMTTVAVN